MSGIGIGPQDLAAPQLNAQSLSAGNPPAEVLPPTPMAAPQQQAAPPPQAPVEAPPAAPTQVQPDVNPFAEDMPAPAAPSQNPFEDALKPSKETMSAGAAALISLSDNDKERNHAAEKIYGKGAVAFKDPNGNYAIKDAGGNLHEAPTGSFKDWAQNPLANLAAHSRLALDIGSSVATDTMAVAGAPETMGASLGLMGVSGAAGQAAADAVKGMAGTFDKTAGEQARDLALNGTINMAAGGLLKKLAGDVGQKAISKAVQNAATADALPIVQREANAMLQAQDELRGMGMNIPSLKAAVTQSSADILELEKNAKTQAGETYMKNLGDSVNQVFHTVADTMTGGGYSQAIRGEKTEVTKGLSEAVQNFQKGTGKEIESWRNEVINKAGNSSYPAPKFADALKNAAQELNMTDAAGNIVPKSGPELEGIQDRVSKKLATLVNKNYEDLFNNKGQTSPDKLLGIYNDLAKTAKAAGGSQYAPELWALRKAALDDFHEIGATTLGVDPAKYGAAMKNYRTALDVNDTFSNIVNNDALSATALADQIFNKGNQAKLEAMRDVMSSANPGLWNDVKSLKLANIARNNMTDVVKDSAGNIASAKMNYEGINKEIQGLGKEAVEAIYGEGSFGSMQNINSYLSRVSKYNMQQLSPAEKQNLIKGVTKIGFNVHTAEMAVNGLAGLFRNKEAAANQFFSNGANLEEIAKGLPPKQKDMVYEAAKRAGQFTSDVVGALKSK